jgi:hypothetical protein
MKNYLLFLTIILTATIISCTKKEDSVSSLNNVTSPFTVKYEVKSTATVHASYGLPMVTYVNSTGQKQTESISVLSANTPWSKTISVTTTSRPLQLSLLFSTSPPDVYRLWLTNAGDIIQNMYVNGVLIASSNNTSSIIANSGEYNIKIVGLDYTIK